MLKNNFQKGSISLPTLAGIAVIVVVVATISVYATIKLMSPSVVVTPTLTPTPTVTPTPTPSITPTPTPDVTAGWETYTNDKYGFEIKHPENIEKYPKTSGVEFAEESIAYHTFFSINIYTSLKSLPNNSAGLSFEKWIDEQVKNKSFEDKKTFNNGVLKGFEVTDQGITTFRNILVQNNNNVYSFIIRKNSNSMDLFDQMLSTFRFSENDLTAGWQTYTKKDYGLSFKYPAEFISAAASLRNETPDYLGRFGLAVNMISLSRSSYPKNTDLSRADILVAINRDVAGGEYFFQSVDKSKGVPPPELEKLSLKKKVVINGITWGMAEKEGAAAGTHSRTRIYHTFQNGSWYEVQLNLWTASDGSVASVNVNDIWNKLESILPTFEFIK